MKKARVMIVEDEPIVAEDIRSCLAGAGFAVSASVSTGEDAVEIVPGANPDVILMDIRLAGRMDGITAARRISNVIDTPVIYLTACADEKTVETAKTTEPFGYLVKPFNRSELTAAIEMTLLRHARDREKEKKIEYLEGRNRALQHEMAALRTAPDSGVDLGHGFFHQTASGNLHYLDREVMLTKKERLFIQLLAENLGRTVSFRRIEEFVWSGRSGVDENSFRIFLWRLRSKVGKELIKNTVGVGYRIDGPRASP